MIKDWYLPYFGMLATGAFLGEHFPDKDIKPLGYLDYLMIFILTGSCLFMLTKRYQNAP